MSNRLGFSIVELMIAIAILGILAFSGAPSIMAWMQGRGVSDAADDLFANLHRVKSLATKRDLNHGIIFTVPIAAGAPGQYQIGVDRDNNATLETILETVNLGRYRGNVRLVAAPGVIMFTPEGLCPAGSSGAAILNNQGSNVSTYRLRATLSGGISNSKLNDATGLWVTE